MGSSFHTARRVATRGWLAAALAALLLGLPVAGALGSEARVARALGSGVGREDEGRTKLYRLKSAYIYNFASFVTWPDSAFASEEAPIVLGVVGQDPFGDLLEEGFSKRRVGKRGFLIKRFESPAELEPCHILFVSSSERQRFGRIIERTRGRPVLVVSEMPGALERGGLIDLFVEQKTVRFAIQLDELERSGLSVSSKLLKLAKIVRDAEGPR